MQQQKLFSVVKYIQYKHTIGVEEDIVETVGGMSKYETLPKRGKLQTTNVAFSNFLDYVHFYFLIKVGGYTLFQIIISSPKDLMLTKSLNVIWILK